MPNVRSRRRALPRVAAHDREAADHYLARTLLTVEGRLQRLYTRRQMSDETRRIASVFAGTDPQVPLWDDYLQVAYLENARDGLLSALRDLQQRHRRQS